ncbi:hypothetical protein ACIBM8_21935 [Micromonospora aurantiaca]|uniref:hypothetical protein n=1 Tax=Micromonospora TaxID=1873 RepID=UPI00340C6396
MVTHPTTSEATVVMRRTIGDWYANAEGRDSADFRRDWDNDDRPDRTPDSWLDRLKPSERPAAVRPSRRSASTSRGGLRGTVPTQRGLADAARELQRRMPGIKDKTLVRHLRQSGWLNVSEEQVRKALRAYPAGPSSQSRGTTTATTPPSANPKPAKTRTKDGGTITMIYPPTDPPPPKSKARGTIKVVSPSPATPKPAKNGTPSRERPTLADVVREVQASRPGLGTKRLTQEVRARGWQGATEKQVKAARKSLPPSPPAPTPVLRRIQVPPPLRTVRTPHPDACFACGVVPSPLGSCRCS